MPGMNANERYERDWVLPRYHKPLPHTRGGSRPDIPSLWERAKEMLARAFTQFPPARTIAQWMRVSRRERRDFNEWIQPVEHLVRSCIIAKAAIFLLMTPQGRRMLRDTPKLDDSASKTKAMAAAQTAPHKISMPHPGWHTIAQPPRPKPTQAEPTQPEKKQKPPVDPLDPATWTATFRTTKWHYNPNADDEGAGKPAFNTGDYLTAIDPYLILPRRERKPKPDFVPPALDMARRLEALTRVLADPHAAIMRTARFLAGIAPEMLRLFDTGYNRPGWLQGDRENSDARIHAHRAVGAVVNTLAQPRPG